MALSRIQSITWFEIRSFNVRFDDRLATILAQPCDDSRSRDVAWRQLVDLLAQSAEDNNPELRAATFAELERLRADVATTTREGVAIGLAGRMTAPDLVSYFANDAAVVAAPVLRRARLNDSSWLGLIPKLSPVVRSLLRHRTDLSPAVSRALDQFGSADLMLSDHVSPAPRDSGDTAEPIQIRDLLARIEAFRSRATPPEIAAPPVSDSAFDFESDQQGVLTFVSASERGALIGIDISETNGGWPYGVDGQVAGAFRRRAAIRSGRLTIAGTGVSSGVWLMSADPVFDPLSGRFLGYSGSARRPRPDELAPGRDDAGLYGTGLTADSLRQLVHELRTPLNAIRGFAEMIDRQILGPVGSDYRTRAGRIVADSENMLSVIDDLDTAARLEAGALSPTEAISDVAAILSIVARDLRCLTDERGVRLRVEVLTGELPVALDQRSVERMMSRLLSAVIGLAGSGEVITAALKSQPTRVTFTVDRPAVLDALSSAQLLDLDREGGPELPAGLALGLGFTLRLITNLAASANARLEIDPAVFTLILPSARDSAGSDTQTG
jgi:hypothetical protein